MIRSLLLGRTLACGGLCLLLLPAAANSEEPAPIDQKLLNDMVASDPAKAFEFAFEAGDELTEAVFTLERGAGANVGPNLSFTRIPRADLNGEGEWASHVPPREGGPQAQSCVTCHAVPLANGAGRIALNVAIDPLQSGDPSLYLERNTLAMFGLGGVQRVAEEMTAELKAIEAELTARACESREPATAPLAAKGVSFGRLTLSPVHEDGACTVHAAPEGIEGVDHDLVVRMFGWKGTAASIREFSRNAAHNEMGMQADELVGGTDGDFDGKTGELTVGDLTAMSVYLAGLERPTSKLELDDLGVLPLTGEERNTILAGEQRFASIGCAECHRPAMPINDPVFTEPSRQAGFFDAVMPSGDTAESLGLSDGSAIRVDLTADQPNNRVTTLEGVEHAVGALRRGEGERALLEWYSDFKRHDMGERLADPYDPYGIGASFWPTRSLAGVGSTGPWLHHGHATTLDEAILMHGGEAQASGDAYRALDRMEREQVIAFLENLVIVDLNPEEEH